MKAAKPVSIGERNVVGGVMPVAAGTLHMLNGDILDGQFENQRQIGAQEIVAESA